MKNIISSLNLAFIVICSTLFFITNGNVQPTSEISLEETNKQIITHVENELELIKLPFAPDSNYTNKPIKSEENTISDGVYVNGLKAHSGKRVFTIYSKDDSMKTEIEKVEMRGNLQIYITDENTTGEKNLVYNIQIDKMTPTKFEVFRNGKLVKIEEIGYGIE
ncbi:hypothetical protein SAMN05216565_12123 [Litchfieldia salsa]|uniref:Uncharacterized protein n=2 Tax=Litchfieldia salsa TaxID=930152 RepID=A0A1H0X046_9BACI|nr:hypothetical protein SAMN05216565_12123 [Litchfieldia salsa]